MWRARAVSGPAKDIRAASGLGVGDRIRFRGETQARWKVRARNGRFLILTQPFNLQHTVLYTVIDLEEGKRGPVDSWGCGFETEAGITESLDMLASDRAALSQRYSVSLHIADIKPRRSTQQELQETVA